MTTFVKILTVCGLYVIVSSTESAILPSPAKYLWKENDHIYVKHKQLAPLKINSNIQRSENRENSLIRKTASKGLDVPLRLYGKGFLSNQFDRNGMIYLSQPRDTDNRNFNALLNKLIQYKTENVAHLRHNTRSTFTDEDIDNLEQKADAISKKVGDGGNDNQSPAVVIELADMII
ncbi:hypothetical protein ACJJTC_002701 [Scirpophaga incertulas]